MIHELEIKSFFIKAKFLYINKEYQKAIESLEKVVTKDSKYKELAYLLLVKCYCKSLDIENTEKYLEIARKEIQTEKIQEQMNTLSIQVETLKNKQYQLALIIEGKRFFNEKNFKEAVKVFKKVLEKNDRFKEPAYIWIIKCYYKSLDIENTEKYLEIARKEIQTEKIQEQMNTLSIQVETLKNKQYQLALITEGKRFFNEKNFKEAVKVFKKVLEKNDRFKEPAYIWIIKCYYKSLDIENAEKYLEIARKEIQTEKIKEQLKVLSSQILNFQNKVLLIGTCRIKRMRAFLKDENIKNRIAQISSHVHYSNEIYQMLEYITYKKNIPLDLIGLVIDDINFGKLKSFEEVEEWRKHTNILLRNSKKIIIEISSIKNFELTTDNIIYGNLTSINRVIKQKDRFAKYINAEDLQDRYKEIVPRYNTQDEIGNLMKKIKLFFPTLKILWVSHFRYKIEGTNNEINERKKLQEWVSFYSSELGDDYLDQTKLIETLGEDKGLKDSSHYSEESEKLMAKIITFWVRNNRVPKMSEV